MKTDCYEEKWEAIKNRVGGKSGEAIVDALKDLYTIYGEELIDWYAGLYDPKIGGYYYSNSARDNESYAGVTLLPDLESTYQVLSFLSKSGMLDYTSFLSLPTLPLKRR